MKYNVQLGRMRQTRHFVAKKEWVEYRKYLVDERTAGRVVGWTTLPATGGVDVICTHRAEGIR